MINKYILEKFFFYLIAAFTTVLQLRNRYF